MSNMTANMIKPIFLTMPKEEQRAFAEWLNSQQNLKSKPKKKKDRVLDRVADQLGEEWRPGNEEMMISKIMHEND